MGRSAPGAAGVRRRPAPGMRPHWARCRRQGPGCLPRAPARRPRRAARSPVRAGVGGGRNGSHPRSREPRRPARARGRPRGRARAVGHWRWTRRARPAHPGPSRVATSLHGRSGRCRSGASRPQTAPRCQRTALGGAQGEPHPGSPAAAPAVRARSMRSSMPRSHSIPAGPGPPGGGGLREPARPGRPRRSRGQPTAHDVPAEGDGAHPARTWLGLH